MKIFALTGGIASGKSTISKRFLELGAHVIDADQLAREAVLPGTAALEQIVANFGPEVLDEDGALNRTALSSIVFRDEEKLLTLNAIVHPAVGELFAKKAAEIADAESGAVVIYEVPLLAEHARDRDWEHVIVATAPENVRIKRLVELRGMSEEDAKLRVQNQATEEERLEVADTIIDTSESLESTVQQVDEFWQKSVRADTKLGK